MNKLLILTLCFVISLVDIPQQQGNNVSLELLYAVSTGEATSPATFAKLSITNGKLDKSPRTIDLKEAPISWSPSGKWLITAKYLSETQYQYCLSDRGFVTIRCIDQVNGNDILGKTPFITWSADEKKISFISTPGDASWQLLEADVQSGKILRSVTDSQKFSGFATPKSWTPDLKIFLSFRTLITLSAETNMPVVIRTLGKPGKVIVSPNATIRLEDQIESEYLVCGFSPQGNYLTAVDQSESGIKQFFLVFDREGKLLRRLDATDGPIPFACPQWRTTEDYFLYWDVDVKPLDPGYTRTHIRKLFLDDFSSKAVYSGATAFLLPVLYESPDGQWIAFITTGLYFPNQIVLLGQNNSIQFFGNRDSYYAYLMWIPFQN